MKRAYFFSVLLLAVAGIGCSGNSSNLASGAKGTPDIVGKWKGELKMPEAKSDDPLAGMGEAFAKMLLGSLTLEIMPDDKFRFTMMGMPIEGTLKRTGNDLELTPETVMGMTPEEAKKMQPEGQKNDMFSNDQPMVGTISADGQTIVMKNKNGKAGEGELTFTRVKEEPDAPAKTTVKGEESNFVGSYTGSVDSDPSVKLTPEKEQERKMAEMFAKSATLELKSDNTFAMTLVFDVEGTWRYESNFIVLKVEKMLGMTDDNATSKNEDKRLRVEDGGRRLVLDEPGEGGDKLVFNKK